jgi:hypothetical protein
MAKKANKTCGTTQNATPVRNTRRTKSPESCGTTNPSYAREKKPAWRIEDTELHTASLLADNCSFIPQGKLGESITSFPQLEDILVALKRLECSYLKLVEDFRQVEMIYSWHDDGVVYIALLPMLELFGIVLPTNTAQVFDEAVQKFCVKFDVFDESIVWHCDGRCFVPSTIVPQLIRMAQFPDAITERLLAWFEAYNTERELAAPWNVQCADQVLE